MSLHALLLIVSQEWFQNIFFCFILSFFEVVLNSELLLCSFLRFGLYTQQLHLTSALAGSSLPDQWHIALTWNYVCGSRF